MTVKLLATGVVAVATIGAAAAGLTSLASGYASAPQVTAVVPGAPLAPPPPPPGAPPLPSPETLSDLATRLTDPGVSYEKKFGLVENGISADEGHVAITGPKFAGPVNKQLAFVDQGGTWVLQHAAALALVQAATAIN